VIVRLPIGTTVRPPTSTDVPSILDVIHSCDIATIGYPDYTEDDVRDDLADPRLNSERDAWLVLGADGRANGWAWIVDLNGRQLLEADIYVRPHAPAVLGSFLVARIIARAAEIAQRNVVPQAEVSIGVVTADTRTAGWLSAAEFVAVRRYSRMEIPLSGNEQPPVLRPGVRIRAVASDDDRRALHRVLFQSFAEHFDTAEEAYDDWSARLAATSTADPEQWWLLEIDGIVAGCVMGSEQLAEENGGWVKNLGVLSEHRGQGFGRALLQHAFAGFVGRGRVKAGLGVDTQNATGALRLYESMGMRAVYQADIWKRRVAVAEDIAAAGEDGLGPVQSGPVQARIETSSSQTGSGGAPRPSRTSAVT
jgi:ribosomal protein S18 acetylase RimI-like enzyme